MNKLNKGWKICYSELETNNDCHYRVDSYFFYNGDELEVTELEEKLYTFTLFLKEETENFEVFSTLQTIQNFSLLTDVPIDLVDLIKEYENDLMEGDKALFYDIRKQFLIPIVVDFVSSSKVNQIAFLGYSIFSNIIEFSIKAFDYESIRIIFNSLTAKFSELDYLKNVSFSEHIKWIRQKQLKVFKKEKPNYNNSQKLLIGSKDNSSTYSKLLLEIKNKGYIDRSYRDILNRDLTLPQYDNLMKIFEKSLLLQVENNKITLMHHSDPLNVKEDDIQTVYTFKPRIWQYYLNDWYEDFITYAIEDIRCDEDFEIKILNVDGNSEYNFKESGLDKDKVELDLIVLLQYRDKYKIVAIECKRTMSNKNRKKIKEKYESKILNSVSNYNLIDAYVNIGYFSSSSDIRIDKIFSNKNNISNKVAFPFITFASTDYQETIKQLKKCFQLIMESDNSISTSKDLEIVEVS